MGVAEHRSGPLHLHYVRLVLVGLAEPVADHLEVQGGDGLLVDGGGADGLEVDGHDEGVDGEEERKHYGAYEETKKERECIIFSIMFRPWDKG